MDLPLWGIFVVLCFIAYRLMTMNCAVNVYVDLEEIDWTDEGEEWKNGNNDLDTE